MKIEDNQIRIIDKVLPDDIFKEFQIENRCVIFPGNLMHSGSTFTDSSLRIVLNINYTC
jgi:hypothetical protein